MSLQTLRELRLMRKRPRQVDLVTMDCPRPDWRWLRDDPSMVWLPASTDVRAHDLRPLVGLPVLAMVDSLARRLDEVRQAVGAVGGLLLGVADGEHAWVADGHPDEAMSAQFADPQWREVIGAGMVIERNLFWDIGNGNSG